MGALVGLPTRGLKEDGRRHAPVNVSQGTASIGIQSPRMTMRLGDIGFNRVKQASLAQLPQHSRPKTGRIQRRRTQRNQRFSASTLEGFDVNVGNPLCKHGQRAPRLLELRQSLPLAMKNRNRRRMEWIAGLES